MRESQNRIEISKWKRSGLSQLNRSSKIERYNEKNKELEEKGRKASEGGIVGRTRGVASEFLLREFSGLKL